MADTQTLLRSIPKVDDLLKNTEIENIYAPYGVLLDALRNTLDLLREDILMRKVNTLPSISHILSDVKIKAENTMALNFIPLINATGIILHTNLGRARLSKSAAQAACMAAQHNINLEFDLNTGKRGHRHAHVEQLVCAITGAEAAMVVNNNAAAVLLMLSALCKEKEVIISRGELVEIGGSFRIPDIMTQSGALLKEVGTTNKTHLFDLENAISEQTGALLKVHTSNYSIVGFTEQVGIEQMAALAKKHHLPLLHDVGSGVLIDLSPYGLHEPTVQQSITAGADIVSFSGDKLLGGPQAGLIVGGKEYVERLKKHPLSRTIRPDKMTLCALEATLKHYLDPSDALASIPTLRMIAEQKGSILKRATTLEKMLLDKYVPCKIIDEFSEIGGGSLPSQQLETYAICIPPADSADAMQQRLREYATPIISRIAQERIVLDLRTVSEEELSVLTDGIYAAYHQ